MNYEQCLNSGIRVFGLFCFVQYGNNDQFFLYPIIFDLFANFFNTFVSFPTFPSLLSGTEYKELLQKNVGLENLPSNYAGTLPALTREIHPYAEGLTVLSSAVPTVTRPAEDSAAVEVLHINKSNIF